MMKFFAFIGLCFVSAVILSVITGVVRGLILRRRAKLERNAEEDLTDDSGDLIRDIHDDLL